MIYRYTVPPEWDGITARDFWRKKIGVSQRLWRRLKWHGDCTVNGQPVRLAVTVLRAGDEIVATLTETNRLLPAADAPTLNIRYEDELLLIVDKPAGILVHPTPNNKTGTLGSAVLAHYAATGQDFIFHPVHRLDRDTTGLVLVAKQPQTQFQLLGQREPRFQRRYLAIINDRPSPAAGIIDAPIGRKDGSIIEHIVRGDGKPARTHYRLLAFDGELSLLECRLETGRTHQIRVHFAHLGTPLLGDDLYGVKDERINRQALHAYRLDVELPGREPVRVFSPLPPDMKELLKGMKPL